MSSYYREHVSFPNVTSGPAPPYPPPAPAPNYAHGVAHNNNGAQHDDNANARRCTVKGCAAVLAPAYPHKMCEECRGRHRIYANTKRAKRKMEKALLNSGQPMAWMPEDGPSQQEEPQEPIAGPSRPYEPSPQIPQTSDEHSQHFDFSQAYPGLFSQASELANALTLPQVHAHPGGHNLFAPVDYQLHQPQQQDHQQRPGASLHAPHHLQQHPQHVQSPGPPPPPPAPEIHPVLAEVLKAVPNLQLSTRITSGPTVPVGASAPPIDGQLPPRFCSIKGCKTLIAGNSFFKMCEPCRNRYRNYGTTKRAKWRKEKEVVVQELKQRCEEENKRRAEQGLPPLPPPDDDIWHEYAASPEGQGGSPGQAGPSQGVDGQPAPRPPRMCTVSHCREILPGDYQYLRCERHRIQNRHHSKLKRVRDKEVKAQVYDGWAAAAGIRDPSAGDAEGMQEEEEGTMSPEEHEADVQLNLADIQHHLREASLELQYSLPHVVAESGVAVSADTGAAGDDDGDGEQLDETPLGEPVNGVPPAARGSRRTNHVCSIRACANLLSPSNPWKMCDLCRSRDRAGRRLKALRDSGLIPPEVVDPKLERMKMEVEGKGSRNTSAGAGGEPGEKKSKKKKKEKGEAAAAAVPKGGGAEAGQPAGDVAAPAEVGVAASGGINTSEPVPNEVSHGSIAPSALQRIPPPPSAPNSQPVLASSSTSVFSSTDQSNIVFMDPLSPEQAAQIKARHEKVTGKPSTVDVSVLEAAPVSVSVSDGKPEGTGQDGATISASATNAPKKRGKGKGKTKAQASSQQNTDQSASASQAPDISNDPQPPTADATSVDAPASSSDSAAPPQYPPIPGYPYFMPPYMPPYPPPQNYAYPYSPPKGQYAPPPPMYQPPYGAYPYPYPGQPYGYPGPPYPPPPGQPYPPPGQGYPPPVQSSPQAGQAYPPPQQYPYLYPPSPFHSPPAPQQPSATEQEDQAAEQQQPTGQQLYEQPQQPQQPQSSLSYNAIPSTPPRPQQETAQPGTTASSSSSETPRPQAPQRFATFIVRTEDMYNGSQGKPSVNGTKRKWDEAELEAGSAYSKFRLQAPVALGSGVDLQTGHYAPVAVESVQLAEGSQADGNPAAGKASCSNKNCKRLLPAGCTGSLCDRCKERLKKKQAKAKHRFKLEPKSLLGRSASMQPNGSGSVTPVVAAVPV